MRSQTSHQRVMAGDAVGPAQFTIDQRTYIDDMPKIGREDPVPSDFHLATITRDSTGGMTYNDLWSDGDAGWRDPGAPPIAVWGALSP